jgi:hypothetical protein
MHDVGITYQKTNRDADRHADREKEVKEGVCDWP